MCKSPSAERIAVAMGRYLDVRQKQYVVRCFSHGFMMSQAPYAVDGLCCFPFSTLCDAAVGAADFIALAERYNTLFLYNVESLENFDERPHEIRRFIELIDVLYERCNRVIFDSRVPLLKVFGDTHVTKVLCTKLQLTRGKTISRATSVRSYRALTRYSTLYAPAIQMGLSRSSCYYKPVICSSAVLQ